MGGFLSFVPILYVTQMQCWGQWIHLNVVWPPCHSADELYYRYAPGNKSAQLQALRVTDTYKDRFSSYRCCSLWNFLSVHEKVRKANIPVPYSHRAQSCQLIGRGDIKSNQLHPKQPVSSEAFPCCDNGPLIWGSLFPKPQTSSGPEMIGMFFLDGARYGLQPCPSSLPTISL